MNNWLTSIKIPRDSLNICFYSQYLALYCLVLLRVSGKNVIVSAIVYVPSLSQPLLTFGNTQYFFDDNNNEAIMKKGENRNEPAWV